MPDGVPGLGFFRTLVTRRTLLYQLVRRDFERRFIGSAAGWLWGVIQPLMLLLSWTFVFHWVMKQRVPEGESTANYTVFLFCGYLPFMLFQETVLRSSTSLVENANLITRTVFPSEMIPVSIFLSSLVNHAITLVIAVAGVLVTGGVPGMAALWIPVYLLILALFSVGVAWIAASLQVYLRDVAQIVTVLLTFWFWLTPIFITERQIVSAEIPDWVRLVPALNPLTPFVRAYRDGLLGGPAAGMASIAVIAGVSLAVFAAGGLIFRQLKRGFADVL
ncbi:MAG: ABC transporter permease [Acidobacteria bacterium]|nr:ABC transporter permease [Acidobacteriota bacterium]